MNLGDIFKNDELLDEQIQSALMSYSNNININNSLKYNFRCNICGDSQKSERKRRAYILKNKDPWVFYCHNCHVSMPASAWLKEFFPEFHKQYIRDSFDRSNETSKNKIVKYENRVMKLKAIEEENKLSDLDKEKRDMKFFVPILKGTAKEFEVAKSICTKRLILESMWNSWYVATDGTYKNRIIIPFLDNKNSIYYYQGRSLYSYMLPKYLSRRGDHNNIYNYYSVDNEKPVFVMEGIIDCLFVENSIGMTGLKIDDKKLHDFKHKYFLLDDDKAGNIKARKLLLKGEKVFIWEKFIKDLGIPRKPPRQDKWDINDVCIHINKKDKFLISDLEQYFTNSFYDEDRFI